MTREDAIIFLKSINKKDTAVCCDGALFTLDEYGVEIINLAIEALEAERPKGHWIDEEVRGFIEPYCSVCGTGLDVIYHYKFCPECGADMRGERNE